VHTITTINSIKIDADYNRFHESSSNGDPRTHTHK
jgi:hypothetical protein